MFGAICVNDKIDTPVSLRRRDRLPLSIIVAAPYSQPLASEIRSPGDRTDPTGFSYSRMVGSERYVTVLLIRVLVALVT